MGTSSFTPSGSGAWKAALLALLAVTGAAQAAPRYKVEDLGLQEFHSTSNALDINNRGEIVGWSLDGVRDGERIGFLWRDGAMQAIKSPDYSSSSSSANSINERGQLALTAAERDGSIPPRPISTTAPATTCSASRRPQASAPPSPSSTPATSSALATWTGQPSITSTTATPMAHRNLAVAVVPAGQLGLLDRNRAVPLSAAKPKPPKPIPRLGIPSSLS